LRACHFAHSPQRLPGPPAISVQKAFLLLPSMTAKEAWHRGAKMVP
jgi:hypothetical protein